MVGPKAPKDPEKKRAGFYIMREKEIFGAPQPDGRGIQFLYQDSGRLINSAQISGNIQDEEILELLKTTQGFRKLVHSIGVRAESETPGEKLEFVFQMYGKEDIYGGGTVFSAEVPGDGMEEKILLSQIPWREEDKEPGQIRFCFPKSGHKAIVSVKLYVNDGFSVPQEEEEEPADLRGEAAEEMISRSLVSLGNPYRLKKAMEKAKKGEPVTLAYIGGSITQGAGAVPIHTECYAWKSYEAFARRFGTGNNVRYIKAGVGGTPSELGMIRFERDVLRGGEKPDVVVVEFAVNDEGDETKGVCYESLVRKILALPWRPAVVLLFSVFANDWNLQERMIPIGEHYHLPMVSVLDAVSPQFGLKKEEGRVVSKNQYFYDMFHPTNLGHTIMARCLENLFEKIDKSPAGADDRDNQLLDQEPVRGKAFDQVRLLDKKDLCSQGEIFQGSFRYTDEDLQFVEVDLDTVGSPEFPYNWQYDGTRETGEIQPFTLKLTCKSLVLVFKDSGEADAGKAQVFVDGALWLTANPLINGWTHCNPVILFQEEEARDHVIEIKPAPGEEQKKFTILGFGYVL